MMKKPELRITERVGDVPTQGTCSACPDTTFHTGSKITTVKKHEQALKRLFQHHFETVHHREDVSQAAARIVKEATKD